MICLRALTPCPPSTPRATQGVLQTSRARCTVLLSSFSRHLELLSIDSRMLKSQMEDSNRGAMGDSEKRAIILKHRCVCVCVR